MKKGLFWILMVIAVSGCTLADVRVNVVSERTALENQVLGSYNALSKEVLLVASVRGVDPFGRIETPPARSRAQQTAVEAVQTLAFHADDVDAFKRLGWVGENNQGLLTPFPLSKEDVPGDLEDFAARYQEAEFNAVLAQVNQSREVVMRRVIETNEAFTMKDLPAVQKVFGKINRDSALPGEKIESEQGAWTIKQ
ncbi:MAG: YdbL family protein [Deltaproteobacteria bacterium]|nr:YdbL family protein [Deltaproteobacteria bacterium]